MEEIKSLEAKDRIILALDVDSIEEVEKYVSLLKDYVGYFKVGLQLFTACGFEAVEVIRQNGGKVYFDGKFQDIPNTVGQTCINLMKRIKNDYYNNFNLSVVDACCECSGIDLDDDQYNELI